jgi:hypothetical protein
MCDFGLGGLSSGRSPDRLDALVWGLTALMLGTGSAAAGQGSVRLTLRPKKRAATANRAAQV